ncbi:MAG: hypothetical protein OXH57_11475 [Ekhidna sp.]|nr:hypothetical protein [Ekhidna sp.]
MMVYGGSSWRWGIIDKYRFQDGDFYLIGYTKDWGNPFKEIQENVDFNLSTGKIIFKKVYDYDQEGKPRKTENETFFKKGVKITLQSRQEISIKIVTPKYGNNIHVKKVIQYRR